MDYVSEPEVDEGESADAASTAGSISSFRTQPGRMRTKTTIVCSECKRLKLACDRQQPCGKCVKKGTANKCIYDPAASGKVDEHSLHNSQLSDRNILLGIADTLGISEEERILVANAKDWPPHEGFKFTLDPRLHAIIGVDSSGTSADTMQNPYKLQSSDVGVLHSIADTRGIVAAEPSGVANTSHMAPPVGYIPTMGSRNLPTMGIRDKKSIFSLGGSSFPAESVPPRKSPTSGIAQARSELPTSKSLGHTPEASFESLIANNYGLSRLEPPAYPPQQHQHDLQSARPLYLTSDPVDLSRAQERPAPIQQQAEMPSGSQNTNDSALPAVGIRTRPAIGKRNRIPPISSSSLGHLNAPSIPTGLLSPSKPPTQVINQPPMSTTLGYYSPEVGLESLSVNYSRAFTYDPLEQHFVSSYYSFEPLNVQPQSLFSLPSSDVGLRPESFEFQGPSESFATKLFRMLNECEEGAPIHWLPEGNGFVITHPDALSRDILPRYYKSGNFSSFVRQLNYYGFRQTNRVSHALISGSTPPAMQFTHPKFQRGKPELVQEIKQLGNHSGIVFSSAPDSQLVKAMVHGHGAQAGGSGSAAGQPRGSPASTFYSPAITIAGDAGDRFDSPGFQGKLVDSFAIYDDNALVSPYLSRVGAPSFDGRWISEENGPKKKSSSHFRSLDFVPRSTNVYWGQTGFGGSDVALHLLRQPAHPPASSTESLLRRVEAFIDRVNEGTASSYGYRPTYLSEYFGTAIVDDCIAVVGPWYEAGNIRDFVVRNPGANRLLLTKQVASALNFLHTLDSPIVHSDLCVENVLIAQDGGVVLCNIGLAQFREEQGDETLPYGTPSDVRRLAPEYLLDGAYTEKTDIYSFGCLALTIMTGREPFAGLDDIGVILALQNGKESSVPETYGTPLRVLRAGLRLIISACLSHAPDDRPLMSAVVMGYRSLD